MINQDLQIVQEEKENRVEKANPQIKEEKKEPEEEEKITFDYLLRKVVENVEK